MGRRLSKAKPMMGGEPQPMQFGPAGPLKGQAAVPGDKSISHRVLMLSAMAVGRSRIEGLSPGSDVHSTARSEEHTSELQSLMRILYAVLCLKKKHKITS